MTSSLDTPVGQFVAAQPLLAKVFESHGIDYCCGGKLPLATACARKGVDAQSVLEEIQSLLAASPQPEVDWTDVPLEALVSHLLDTHHVYLRAEMPRLAALSIKVANVHGDRHPELVEVAHVYHKFYTEMDAHLSKEEQILFPAIARLEQGLERFPVQHPIRKMELDHDDSGRDLERMRELTAGYTPPEDACNSYRALLAGLAELEQDTFTHIHKENNILFQRAIAMLETR